MGTFVIFGSGISDSVHALHLHSFIAKVKQSENVGTYVHF